MVIIADIEEIANLMTRKSFAELRCKWINQELPLDRGVGARKPGQPNS
jgi:hypothetical protein